MDQTHPMSVDIADMSFHQPRKHPKLDYPRNSCLREWRGKKKQLRFAKTSTLIVTQPKTASEMALSWYNKHDLCEFKTDIKNSSQVLSGTRSAKAIMYIGRCIKTGEPHTALPLDDVERIRGLEHLVSQEGCRLLVQGRRETIARDLQEQARQEEDGSHDVEKIASVSRSTSEFAMEWRRRILLL